MVKANSDADSRAMPSISRWKLWHSMAMVGALSLLLGLVHSRGIDGSISIIKLLLAPLLFAWLVGVGFQRCEVIAREILARGRRRGGLYDKSAGPLVVLLFLLAILSWLALAVTISAVFFK